MQSNTKRHPANPSCVVVSEKKVRRPVRERVLLEFPATLLRRADQAAAELDASRSELVRTALEQLLNDMEKKKLESELAEAYTANAAMNLELAKEFKHVDQEGF
jgi:metal-responsive CopG/Arc/MetJ family transcriptional regulator